MGDIKFSLKADHDFDDEIAYLKSDGSLWYPLSVKGPPRKLLVGDIVYFTLRGELVGRSTIEAIEPPEPTVLFMQKGEEISKDRWGFRINNIEKAKNIIKATGVQGYQYLEDAELRLFQAAF